MNDLSSYHRPLSIPERRGHMNYGKLYFYRGKKNWSVKKMRFKVRDIFYSSNNFPRFIKKKKCLAEATILLAERLVAYTDATKTQGC